MIDARPPHPRAWSTNQRATDILADALTKGDVADLNLYTRGEHNEELVISITVRHGKIVDFMGLTAEETVRIYDPRPQPIER